MLSHMAWLSEEILRACEEKVNIAQAAYVSVRPSLLPCPCRHQPKLQVDRHIRLVDQAIKEQQISISLGMRSGTQPAPIVLPDIVVPRLARPPRTAESPELDEDMTTLGIVVHSTPQSPKGKGKKNARKKHPAEEIRPEDVPDTRRSTRKTITAGPAVPQYVIPPSNSHMDPKEPRYCHCGGVSYGKMIACDGKKCKGLWVSV
jgi:hypothetical protein